MQISAYRLLRAAHKGPASDEPWLIYLQNTTEGKSDFTLVPEVHTDISGIWLSLKEVATIISLLSLSPKGAPTLEGHIFLRSVTRAGHGHALGSRT